MGEVAEMMLNGTLCEGCGVNILAPGESPAGFPQYCSVTCADDRGAHHSQIKRGPHGAPIGESVDREKEEVAQLESAIDTFYQELLSTLGLTEEAALNLTPLEITTMAHKALQQVKDPAVKTMVALMYLSTTAHTLEDKDDDESLEVTC